MLQEPVGFVAEIAGILHLARMIDKAGLAGVAAKRGVPAEAPPARHHLGRRD